MIISYIHICQKEGWKRSFDLIFGDVKKYGLYEATTEIRLSVLFDDEFCDDVRFKDPKMKIVHFGTPESYERPCLLHMRNESRSDPDGTMYYYLHTKGLKHFGTIREGPVLDWIKLMLYWNIERWDLAVSTLKQDYYWCYGCNNNRIHYCGNFFWTKKSHLQELPTYIPDYYTAPEDFICMRMREWYQPVVPVFDQYYSAHNSGLGNEHYEKLYPEDNYRI